jgi:hypothetical protein
MAIPTWPTVNGVIASGINSALINAPAFTGSVLTKSDATVYDPPWRGLYVGGTGDVNVGFPDGSTAIFSAVPVGTIIPVICYQLRSTSTTATLVVGLR